VWGNAKKIFLGSIIVFCTFSSLVNSGSKPEYGHRLWTLEKSLEEDVMLLEAVCASLAAWVEKAIFQLLGKGSDLSPLSRGQVSIKDKRVTGVHHLPGHTWSESPLQNPQRQLPPWTGTIDLLILKLEENSFDLPSDPPSLHLHCPAEMNFQEN
jgi:hypothetical protein